MPFVSLANGMKSYLFLTGPTGMCSGAVRNVPFLQACPFVKYCTKVVHVIIFVFVQILVYKGEES